MTRVVKSVLAGILRVPTPLALDEPETMVHRRSTRLTNCQFTPFGGERPYTNTCSQNYKFEGKERDTETGNDDFGARYYSNRFGRWLSADWSAVPVAVPYATLANPQTLNLYSMVSDDPETSADLDGHCPFCLGALAVAGGGTLETAGAVA
jgi:RHS repeat-associated protein